MPAKSKNALPVTRQEDFAEWYQAVIQAADMGEWSGVRGCMIIKPWGYKIWERIQRTLDDAIQATGHDNCYFPLFIPLDLIQKEASHVEGFAKEMAVVTHHRLEARDGALVPAAPLEPPLIVRPTSEALITPALKRWIQSYRDLPLKLNQWANVVRWEMRPRMFLRTSEFLWQEGHTVHASSEEAMDEARTMLGVYQSLAEDMLAIPTIPGVKSAGERFPGALETHTIEAMMQDGRALQAGTSHYLGQNFAQAADIQFIDRDGQLKVPYTTSWGVSTRLIGACIMVHGDDDGLKLAPRLAPYQVVIVPVLRDEGQRSEVMAACEALASSLRQQSFAGEAVRVLVDVRDENASEKRWRWIKRGVPLICELGPRDLAQNTVVVHNRLDVAARASPHDVAAFAGSVAASLGAMQASMKQAAEDTLERQTRETVGTLAEMQRLFENETCFVRARWCGSLESEELVRGFGVTIRCIPYDQRATPGPCVLTGQETTQEAIFAKAY